MLTVKSNHNIQLYAIYTDKLGLHLDGTPKLLGHIRYDYMSKQWFVEPNLSYVKNCRRDPWPVKNMPSGFQIFKHLERKLTK